MPLEIVSRRAGGPVGRVHVIGAAGSGKTFLAAIIAGAIQAEHHQLDRIAFSAGHSAVPWPRRRAAATAIAERPSWVTEGIYVGWTEPLLAAADVIVWLDVPWWLATTRIVGRHVRNSLRGDNEWRGIRLLVRFLWSTRLYYLGPPGDPGLEHADEMTSRQMTLAALAPHGAKVTRCRSRDEVRSLIAGWHQAVAR